MLRSFILPSSKSSATAVPSKCPADAIARALVNNPKVLLLDEPLGALDYQLRKNLQLELKNLQRGLGLTFIYVTHDQEEALTMSDRIVVMNKGVIEQDDNPDNIYHYPSTKFVAKVISSILKLKLWPCGRKN